MTAWSETAAEASAGSPLIRDVSIVVAPAFSVQVTVSAAPVFESCVFASTMYLPAGTVSVTTLVGVTLVGSVTDPAVVESGVTVPFVPFAPFAPFVPLVPFVPAVPVEPVGARGARGAGGARSAGEAGSTLGADRSLAAVGALQTRQASEALDASIAME